MFSVGDRPERRPRQTVPARGVLTSWAENWGIQGVTFWLFGIATGIERHSVHSRLTALSLPR